MFDYIKITEFFLGLKNYIKSSDILAKLIFSTTFIINSVTYSIFFFFHVINIHLLWLSDFFFLAKRKISNVK